jgi:hypothetical protein
MTLKKAEGFAYVLMGLLILVGAILGFLIFYQENKTEISKEVVFLEDVVEQTGPREYMNDTYNFSVTLPEGWQVHEGTIGTVPAFNFYPGDKETLNKSYTHFDNVTHVSVYPQGIPTEGLFAQTRPLDVKFQIQTAEKSHAYLLGNAEIFARYVVFSSPPSTWNQSGFLWTHTKVENQGSSCLQGGQYVEGSFCDPLLGDEIVVTGEVRTVYDADMQSIIESFIFTK